MPQVSVARHAQRWRETTGRERAEGAQEVDNFGVFFRRGALFGGGGGFLLAEGFGTGCGRGGGFFRGFEKEGGGGEGADGGEGEETGEGGEEASEGGHGGCWGVGLVEEQFAGCCKGGGDGPFRASEALSDAGFGDGGAFEGGEVFGSG